MAEKREILKRSVLFRDFSEDVLDRFLNSAETRAYGAGDIIFAELSEGDEIFMIVQGEVTAEVALANADQNLKVQTASAGDVFGEGAFFQPNVQRYATLTAKTATTVLVWKSAAWRKIAESDFEVGYRLAVALTRMLLERVRHWNTQILENMSWGLDL